MVEQFNNLVIFELANNHQGSVSHAKYIIEKIAESARKYGIKAAVKLQYRDLDTLIHPDFINRDDVKHIPRFRSTKLSPEEFQTIVTAIRNAGLITMCTPFDENSVDLCVSHNIEIIKVASCSANDWPLLDKIASVNKPVIISTGGKTFDEIDNIYNFFTHRNTDFALMHCVGLYPPQPQNIQLNCIDKMISRYPGVPIGYSGHEDPQCNLISQMAIAKGAAILERHVGHKTDEISLNAYSLEVDNINSWIEDILTAREICGERNKKVITEDEIRSMNELARGVYAANEIQIGENLTRDKVCFAMPCGKDQTSSGEWNDCMTATAQYKQNTPISEERLINNISRVRRVIHEVKGMLSEAKIVIPNTFELELSHHYGMEKFREIGATIINILNREYCKKIIIILPGQKHPEHYHKDKSETFQVLCGALSLNLDGKKQMLTCGNIVTIERNMLHSFSSESGCIFEEISSTHIKSDSFYSDPEISHKDIIERKTVLKEW
jgi:N-acetylneuraminate synthase